MPFTFHNTPIRDLVIVEPRVFPDERGFFLETYKKSDFQKIGINENFAQDNHSFSHKGVIRGLHYQLPPKAQGKLVRVIRGAVWDVAADIRTSSPTFKKWFGVELSDGNARMLYIPPGFAHGFIALTDEVHLTYKCTEEYAPEADAGIRWDDPDIGIEWPEITPIVSEKDAILPYLSNATLFP